MKAIFKENELKNLFFAIVLIMATVQAFAQYRGPGRDMGLYCDNYVTRNGQRGYTIIREFDRRDLGNAIFYDLSKCQQAVSATRNGIVCSPYFNNNTQVSAYSIYRISDLRDLGNSTFIRFDECQMSVQGSLHDTFCAPYRTPSGRSGYSFYSIRSGQDIGSSLFHSLESCLSRLKRMAH